MERRCCGCCDYRTGVIALGTLCTIFGIVGLILTSIQLSECQKDQECLTYNGISLASNSISFFAGVLLLLGVTTRKPAMFLPYCIIVILNSILFFAIAIFSFVHSAILYGVIGLAVAALEAYFAFVVYMYKRILTRQNEAMSRTI